VSEGLAFLAAMVTFFVVFVGASAILETAFDVLGMGDA
jgi:hypothetical protein